MIKYLQLIRVKHWIKNLLIFIPVIFSKSLNYKNIIICILGFFSFSFLTSFIYIINDIKDIEKDKLHERKKNRPLPSGKIKKKTAIFISIVMLIISLLLNSTLSWKNVNNYSYFFLIAYMLLNIAYSFGLKNVAIIDVIILSTGFILRVYYGAEIIGVNVSNWLFLTILSASLFLGLGKRKKEFGDNKHSRKVLEKYSEEFLDKFQYLFLALTLVFYSLWTMESNNSYLVFTIPIIIIIFMKYSLIIEKNDEGDPTTILYQDKLLFGLCFIYSLIMIILVVVL